MKRTLVIALAAAVLLSTVPPVTAGETGGKYSFKFGGFFKTDMILDNARVYPGDYALWMVDYNEDETAFYLTARETRLGFDFAWDDEKFKTTAKLEFDFYGSGDENKAQPMIRHAYMKLSKSNWSILAGQTWDVISPLNPKTANYSVLWCQGNIGYRRPQVRFSAWGDIGDGAKVSLDVALARTLGSDQDADGLDDGADASIPSIQGRLGLNSKLGDEGSMGVGVSGHFGQEKWGPEDSTSTDSWSLNADLSLKVNSRVSFAGEFFTGENLGTYLGGIYQRVDPLHDPLPAVGGWGMISLKLHDRVTFNGGYSFDDPDEAKYLVPADGEPHTFKNLNSEMFGNFFIGITGNVTAIFEAAYMKTEYMTRTDNGSSITDATADYDGLRLQLSLKADIK